MKLKIILTFLFCIAFTSALSIDFQPSETYVSGNITMNISSIGDYMNITVLDDEGNYSGVSNIPEDYIYAEIVTDSSDDGNYTFTIDSCNATDCITESKIYVVDNTPPTITFYPTNDSSVSGTFLLDIEVIDDNFDYMNLTISNETEVIADGTIYDQKIYENIPTTEDDDGRYYIDITACDKVGQCVQDGYTFLVDNYVAPVVVSSSSSSGSGNPATYWNCTWSDWGACVNGSAYRVCNITETTEDLDGVRLWNLDSEDDKKSCANPEDITTTYIKPIPEPKETIADTNEEEKGISWVAWLIGILILVVVAGLLIYYFSDSESLPGGE